MRRMAFGALILSTFLLGNTSSYTVESGDTLSHIAKKHDTTIDKICEINGITRSTKLKIGQTLKLNVENIDIAIRTTIISGESHGGIMQEVSNNSPLQNVLFTLGSKTQKVDTKSLAPKDIQFTSNPKLAKLPEIAKSKMGTKYVWGGTTPAGFDCSGFTVYACKQNGITIPRTSIEQSKAGVPVSRDALKPGDLVFFDTSKQRRGYVNHVGIYMGDGKFIHASSAKKQVIVTSLDSPFYNSRYKGARRVD